MVPQAIGCRVTTESAILASASCKSLFIKVAQELAWWLRSSALVLHLATLVFGAA
jgi:hypothetical protein